MNRLVIVASLLLASPAFADAFTDAVKPCWPNGEIIDGEVTPAVVTCYRTVLSKAERDMTAAYQQRLKVTGARRELARVQALWAQSTDANCKFFGNPESVARYACFIDEMIRRKQRLDDID